MDCAEGTSSHSVIWTKALTIHKDLWRAGDIKFIFEAYGTS